MIKSKGSETLLVVEDDNSIRHLIIRTLKSLGYKMLDASNGKEAVRISNSYNGEIHLLLTDVIMPGMNGCEVNETLSALRPEIKVLFMSGYTYEVIAHHCILEPETAFIQKPLTTDKLAGEIRAVLDD